MRADPRVRKRSEGLLRRELRELIERRVRARRCFWTWRWGHDYGRWVTTHATSPVRLVTRCRNCGRPCSYSSFTALDLLDLAADLEVLRGDEHEEFLQRWRDIP